MVRRVGLSAMSKSPVCHSSVSVMGMPSSSLCVHVAALKADAFCERSRLLLNQHIVCSAPFTPSTLTAGRLVLPNGGSCAPHRRRAGL
jgi:hypothetical protein